jgi:hypothetical protein
VSHCSLHKFIEINGDKASKARTRGIQSVGRRGAIEGAFQAWQRALVYGQGQEITRLNCQEW